MPEPFEELEFAAPSEGFASIMRRLESELFSAFAIPAHLLLAEKCSVPGCGKEAAFHTAMGKGRVVRLCLQHQAEIKGARSCAR